MKLFVAALCLLAVAYATPGDLCFRPPTDNDALFRGDNEGFFMYCDRNFEGQKTQPWEAGGYGLVRNPFRASDGSLMFSRIHEGIDIKPLKRNAAGEPEDMVRPIAPGRVVYVSNAPGASNYGRYVVIAHKLPEGEFYSLYAHLAAITCAVGQQVGTGNDIGKMGHTGSGLDRVRSHVHLELCFLINSAYEQFAGAANKHGNFNGLNLVSINAADVLKQCQNGEPFSLSAYLATLPEHYRVRTPAIGTPDFLHRYTFLYKGDWGKRPAAFDIAFTAEGVPLAVYPADEAVTAPKVISCKSAPTVQQNITVNRLKNSSQDAALTVSGQRYIEQFLWLPDRPETQHAYKPHSTAP